MNGLNSSFLPADFLLTEELPIHMKEELRRLNDKQEAERKQKELDKSICKVSEMSFLHVRKQRRRSAVQ